MMVEVYCTIEYRAMMLNRLKLVANPPLHSLIRCTMQLMFATFDVNGADIEASDSDSEQPISACLSAPQSLEPSPHIAVTFPMDWKADIILALWFGLALANTLT